MTDLDSPPSPSQLHAACLQYLENAKRAGVTHVHWPGGVAALAEIRRARTSAAPKPQSVSLRPRSNPPNLSVAPPPRADANQAPKSSQMVADGTSLTQQMLTLMATEQERTKQESIIALPVIADGEMEVDARQAHFEDVQQIVCQCERCPDLVRNRSRTVFGVGNLKPRVVFFGEAPGADEDRLGEPFVGRAGQLLNKILEASKFKREEVYIMNAVKCRPPNNRTPLDSEIENCRPFFERQLAVLKPEFIVCLGAVAVKAVLRSTQSVGSLRGRFHQAYGARVVVTYHPSYLLRTESAKKYTWEDMKMLMRAMGIPIPGETQGGA